MLVGGMTHSSHTNSADVCCGFRLLVSNQVVTFECLLAEIHLSDIGCLCSAVGLCFAFGWNLEDVLLSQLPGELDALKGTDLRGSIGKELQH